MTWFSCREPEGLHVAAAPVGHSLPEGAAQWLCCQNQACSSWQMFFNIQNGCYEATPLARLIRSTLGEMLATSRLVGPWGSRPTGTAGPSHGHICPDTAAAQSSEPLWDPFTQRVEGSAHLHQNIVQDLPADSTPGISTAGQPTGHEGTPGPEWCV